MVELAREEREAGWEVASRVQLLTSLLLQSAAEASYTESEEEEFIGEDAWEFEEALAAPGDPTADPYYFVQSRIVSRGDIWHAARVGDAGRVGELANDVVDPNQRDQWDSTPLYYACLAGHHEVAQRLLEAGASCSEHTFDGERCFYVALNASIRQLLTAYAQRPPPLPPLGSALRALCTLCDDPEAQVAPSFTSGSWADFGFEVSGHCIPLHKAIIGARSVFFRRMLQSHWQSLPGSKAKTVRLEHSLHMLHPAALPALLVWCYTERLDLAMADVEAAKRLAKRCKMRSLVAALEAEQKTSKYQFKTLRREQQPRRLIIQPSALDSKYRLSADLSRLLLLSEQLSNDVNKALLTAEDFADICILAGGKLFRCHRYLLAARSDYFAALFQHTSLHRAEGSEDHASRNLPTLTVCDVNASVFAVLLQHIYTDRLASHHGQLPGWLLMNLVDGVEEVCDAANKFLVFPLMKQLAEALIACFERRPQLQGGLEGICRLMLIADMYSVTLLRDHCLRRLAARFRLLADGTAPHHESVVFNHFLNTVASEDARPCSKNSLETVVLLQDLREVYLEACRVEEQHQRDRIAEKFDRDLECMAMRGHESGVMHRHERS